MPKAPAVDQRRLDAIDVIDPDVMVDEDDELYHRADVRAMRELDAIVRSRTQVIFIVTAEEQKMLDVLGRYCDLLEKKLVMWDCVSGPSTLIAPRNQRTISGDAQVLVDPMDMLRWIEEDVDTPGESDDGGGGGALYVMLDLHNFLQCSLSGAVGQMDGTEREIIRKMRSMSQALRADRKNLIIVSRDRVLPTDLQEISRVVEWPLPTKEEIRSEVDNLVGQLQVKVGKMEDDVDKTLPAYTDDERDEMARAFGGMTTDRIIGTFRENTVRDYQITPEDHIARIIEAKRQIISGSDCGLTYIPTDQLPGIDDIGGLSMLKDYIRRRQRSFSEAARAYGLPHLKGLLLIGVQGCGKSMTAKAVGRLWRLPTLRLDMGSIFTGLVGGSENRIRRAIQYMEAIAPCVVWLDEIEKAMAGTGSSDRSDAGTAARVFSTMLTWLSDKTSPVYVIATANNPQTLPAEMIRDGRFDDRFFIDLPTEPERAEIFRSHLTKVGRDPGNFDLPMLSGDDVSANFSGAEIEACIIAAMTDGFFDGVEFETRHVLAACQDKFPLAVTMAEQVQGVRGWARDRCRPASEQLAVMDRQRRRQTAAKKLVSGDADADSEPKEELDVDLGRGKKRGGEGPDLGD